MRAFVQRNVRTGFAILRHAVFLAALLFSVCAAAAEEGVPQAPASQLPAAPSPSPASAPASRPSATGAGPERPVSMPTATTPAAGGPAGFVDILHGSMTRGFLASALWLDSFFGDERYTSEVNRSYFKVTYQRLNETWDWTRYRPDYELRLVLPQLRRQTRLVFSSDVRGEGEDPATDTIQALPPAAPKDRQVDTSLQLFLPAPDRHSTSIRAGVKYHSGEIAYYLGPRYRYLLPLDGWTFRFTEDVVWGTVKGWESKTTLDLERPVAGDLFFRASTEGTWSADVNGYAYFISLLLRQPLDPKRALEYEEINYFHTRPNDELNEVKLVVRYRQQFWRNWLYFEIAPQLRFPRDKSFHGVPGILFKFELFFGGIRA